jgi:hypothetical protein
MCIHTYIYTHVFIHTHACVYIYIYIYIYIYKDTYTHVSHTMLPRSRLYTFMHVRMCICTSKWVCLHVFTQACIRTWPIWAARPWAMVCCQDSYSWDMWDISWFLSHPSHDRTATMTTKRTRSTCMHLCMYACMYVCMYACMILYTEMEHTHKIHLFACLFVFI